MPIAHDIAQSIEKSSWIRKMFEEGTKLKALYGAENVYDFTLGNPDVEPPEQFFDELKKLSDTPQKGIHGYMSNAGFPDVRKSIAEKVSREQSCIVSMDGIIMTCGAAGAMNVVLKTILDPGDQVIVPKPYFVEYGFYAKNHGGEMVLVDTNGDFSLNIENIEKAVTDKTRAIIINSPNNPTGAVYSEETIKSLADCIIKHSKKRSIYLISDEPYRDIVYNNKTVPGIFNYCPQSIIATSYSKSLSIPGERIGYCAVNPACKNFDTLMAGLILSNRILGYVNAPALMQRVVGSLNDVVVDITPYEKRKNLFVNGLKEAGYSFTEPDGAFYIFCKAPGGDDVAFVKHLQKYNILIVPGVGFGGPGYFRIAFCVSEESIKKALPIFKKALQEYNP
ncbi:MAG TPA: pyridoxal phosphate-dependent aminotransferase [Spirochaetota bacterium]|nr:pyridoxal phosphate-dependent aminotransferase [Spirochaetota bacterium]HPI89059.1 pyridoxal phosphate-dependent aminotransferase [Spirochaetota bacterium]HPR48730.1 pyridoxal phosphate-dependent aminotransferase [Spirochaetota bacterium]